MTKYDRSFLFKQKSFYLIYTNVGAVDVAGLFPNKLEFNVDVVVVFVPKILCVVVVAIIKKIILNINEIFLVKNYDLVLFHQIMIVLMMLMEKDLLLSLKIFYYLYNLRIEVPE